MSEAAGGPGEGYSYRIAQVHIALDLWYGRPGDRIEVGCKRYRPGGIVRPLQSNPHAKCAGYTDTFTTIRIVGYRLRGRIDKFFLRAAQGGQARAAEAVSSPIYSYVPIVRATGLDCTISAGRLPVQPGGYVTLIIIYILGGIPFQH